MKFFTKQELISLFIIFLVLVGISWPNFALSMRRARDQIRRDDIGNIQAAIDEYYDDYGIFPLSTSDGKMLVCKGPGNEKIGPDGKVQVDLVPCRWGHDTWINLTPGVNKTYMKVLPGDPQLNKGISYVYFSDGSRYQLLAYLEGGKDETEYDGRLEKRGVKCGDKICNLGRANNVPLYISVEEYGLQVYCSEHPKAAKCINRTPIPAEQYE
jgi:type II secretory pathway pseudopilin PulG